MASRKKAAQGDLQEIQHIKEDISSLRSNVIALTRHLKDNGEQQLNEKLDDLEARAEERLINMKTNYHKGLKRLEDQVKDKPGQSLTMAFCSGLLLSMLLGNRH